MASPAFRTALGLIEELKQKKGLVDELRQKLRSEETELRNFEALVDNLRGLMNQDEKKELERFLSDYLDPIEIRLNQGTDNYKKILELISVSAGSVLTVDYVNNELSRRGVNLDTKYINNTLLRLSDRGVLSKIGRGRYMLKGYGGVADELRRQIERDTEFLVD